MLNARCVLRAKSAVAVQNDPQRHLHLEHRMSNPLQLSLRRYSRIPFQAEATLRLHDRTIAVQLLDIAFKGALLQTMAPLALVPQEDCSLILPLTDGGDSIIMSGKIVHLEDRRVGMACDDIDVTSLTRLRRLIELNTGDAELMNRELSHLFAVR